MKRTLTISALAVIASLGLVAGAGSASAEGALFCKKPVIGDSGDVLYYVRDFSKACRGVGNDQPERFAEPTLPEKRERAEPTEVEKPDDRAPTGEGTEPPRDVVKDEPDNRAPTGEGMTGPAGGGVITE